MPLIYIANSRQTQFLQLVQLGGPLLDQIDLHIEVPAVAVIERQRQFECPHASVWPCGSGERHAKPFNSAVWANSDCTMSFIVPLVPQ